MKSNLLAILLLLGFSLQGTTQIYIADPATSNMEVRNFAGAILVANDLQKDQVIHLKVPIYNNMQDAICPYGSIQIRIGLGSKMIVDPGFLIENSPLNNYFAWSSIVNGGQTQITGMLINPLPEDFIGIASFRVKPNILGTSIITTNVQVTNDFAPPTLSDLVPNNNTATLMYTVVELSAGPLPVTFTKLNVLKKGCNINVNFFTQNEINVDHYEIESSKDGINFVKVGTVTAAGRTSYLKDFPLTQDVKATTIYVRVKSVDIDGSFKYSETKPVAGLCESSLQYNIYPNPVTSKNLTLLATSGLFNGKYKLVIMDMQGRLVQAKEAELHNTTQYNYDLGTIAPGKYILKIANYNGSETRALPFEKF